MKYRDHAVMAAWIKIVFGMSVHGNLRNRVLDGGLRSLSMRRGTFGRISYSDIIKV